MVKNAISDYSSTAASNTDVGGVNIDEGMSPSGVNNAIRELMSHLADLNAGSSSLGTIKVDNLQLDGNAITSTDTNGNIALTPNGTGSVVIDGINYPQADGTANYFLKTDGAGQLSFAQVDTASIAADAIDGTKIADDSIDSEHYVDGSIDTAHIADTAVTDAKISGMSSSKLSGALPAIDGSALTGISAGLSGPDGQVFTSSGTFTVPTGVTSCKVTVVGGGGGGGAATGTGSAACGGAGGGAAIEWITGLTGGSTVTVTIGAGGSGSSNTSGTTGGTSSFGSYCSATGGGGSVAATSGVGYAPTGGVGSGGDLNIYGGRGGSASILTTGSSYLYRSGAGGAPLGHDGMTSSPGQRAIGPDKLRKTGPFGGFAGGSCYHHSQTDDATGYGCGGSGGAAPASTNGPGGNGFAGIVIVEY
jgi:hypothetical protein